MRLNHLAEPVHLSYCTNIHAGDSWNEIRDSLDAHVPAIKARVAPDRPFGIGLRLSGAACEALGDPQTLQQFKQQLTRLGAYVFSINAFPYGQFHGMRVKEHAYLPDWRDPERAAFTTRCARILAQLLPEGVDGSISTVPGAFKEHCKAASAPGDMAARMVGAVADLVDIERSTGKTIALAIEPEPCCFLETVEETLEFFDAHLFAAPAMARLSAMSGLSPVQAQMAMRRHIGVCYDVCHGAVQFEDPVAALHRLRGAGIAVPKIQLSCALRIPDMHTGLVEALERFDDGVYLHQVVARGSSLQRFSDLSDALAALRGGQAQGEWRVHCHVPIFLLTLGDMTSTRQELTDTLKALGSTVLSTHLEVETYTWDVLPQRYKSASKSDAIARELEFVIEELNP
jgi:sugar phosphate isomerase/epimerase